jgi:hypothetical protein
MQKSCPNCAQNFEITDEDLAFYDRISPVIIGKKYPVSPPTLCPDCRQQRRLAFRNEKKFYKRKCDFSGKEIISIYSPDKPCAVYDNEIWWSDKWDPLSYGRPYDFNRTFFEQYNELNLAVPRPAIVNMSSENSVYTNHSAYNKNCYMCINTGYSEDLLYVSNFSLYSKDCADCLAIQNCELCYFCVNTKDSYSSRYLYECEKCMDSAFLYDCRNCQNCFGCWNLRNKKYCISNIQYSKEKYEEKIKQLLPKTWKDEQKFFADFWQSVERKAVHRGAVIDKSENSTGDHLNGNKNARDSYYIFGSEDCAHCYDAGEIKTSYDAYEPFKGELQYETHACNLGYGLMACSKCYEDDALNYCQYCWYSSNLFGCFGMKKQKYCILNKQYTKEEYEKLVPKIIEHMQRTGEWGEFFPAAVSPFGYNETAAQDYYPHEKNEILKKGWKWKDAEIAETINQNYKIPSTIDDVPDSITDEVLQCTNCKKNYRIVIQEVKFYRNQNLPIPEHCFDCRHKTRMSLRNPRKFYPRQCAKCGAKIQTTYAPDRQEKVYCEQCYLKEVY